LHGAHRKRLEVSHGHSRLTRDLLNQSKEKFPLNDSSFQETQRRRDSAVRPSTTKENIVERH
jgi:hypothetical protein